MKTPWTRVSEQATWLAFEAEAMPHVDRLFRHAMWLERDRAEAEDLVQETLVQALQSFHRFTARDQLPCVAGRQSCSTCARTGSGSAGASSIEVGVEERVANVVPFVPPVPERLTDEDMLLALSRFRAHHRRLSCSATWRT